MDRMRQENDFARIREPVFFSTSQQGQLGPEIGQANRALLDAFDLDALGACDVIITCQGGDYTSQTHSRLHTQGWNGYWIDAASTLRLRPDAIIVLDPVNRPMIEAGLNSGQKNYVGGNCTVSLMLMALNGLIKDNLVDWISVATYQAISGAGARQMREFIRQMGVVYDASQSRLDSPASNILDIDRQVLDAIQSANFPTREIGHPLIGNLLPWIDSDPGSGSSREEWKGSVETNRILGRSHAPIPIESTCVRIGTMRCHSQAFTLKLNQDLSLEAIESRLDRANDWVHVIPNRREESLRGLTPARVSGTLDIPVGRIRKLSMGPEFVSGFTVGDQLLWGAAEPLRRMLAILAEHEERHQTVSEETPAPSRQGIAA